MNPALLKRQTETANAGMVGNRYMRFVTAEDWTVNRKEDRLEAEIDFPANASIEGRLQGRLPDGCNFSSPSIEAIETLDEGLRFRAHARAQRSTMYFHAGPISSCSSRALWFVLVGKDQYP